MGNAISKIIEAGISLGLADKKAFVEKISGMIEAYQEDPAKAEKWALTISNYLEQLKDDMRLQRIIEQSNKNSGAAGSDEFERLTKAIEKLTAELQNRKSV
jgi:general stress protein 26